MPGFEPDIYHYFEKASPYINIWIGVFFAFTLVRLTLFLLTQKRVKIYNTLISESTGVILVLNHTVCFFMAIMAQDLFSCLLYAWWGPGFIVTAIAVVLEKRKLLKINWARYGLITSIACKLCYVIFIAIYAWLGCYSIIFSFSIWIVNDQINLAWFCDNADRTRRTLEDYWILRVLYVGGLFVPLFLPIPHASYLGILGVSAFLVWAISLVRLIRNGTLRIRPQGNSNFLREIVYLSTDSETD